MIVSKASALPLVLIVTSSVGLAAEKAKAVKPASTKPNTTKVATKATRPATPNTDPFVWTGEVLDPMQLGPAKPAGSCPCCKK